MTEDAPEKTKGRWLKPALFVSVALNLVILGTVVGHELSPEKRKKRSYDGPARGVIGEPFFRALPDGERRALFEDIRKDDIRIRDSRESLRERFQAFLSALRADPFDPDQVTKLLAEQREAAIGRQEIGELLLMKRLTAMTAQQRATYADRLEESLKRFKRR